MSSLCTLPPVAASSSSDQNPAHELKAFIRHCQEPFAPNGKWTVNIHGWTSSDFSGKKHIMNIFHTFEKIHELHRLKEQIPHLGQRKIRYLYQTVFQLLYTNKNGYYFGDPIPDTVRAELIEIAKHLPFRKRVIKLLDSAEFTAFRSNLIQTVTILEGLPSINPFLAAELSCYDDTLIPLSKTDKSEGETTLPSKQSRDLRYLTNLFLNVFANAARGGYIGDSRYKDAIPIHEIVNNIWLLAKDHGIENPEFINKKFETTLERYVLYFNQNYIQNVYSPDQLQSVKATQELAKEILSQFPDRDLPYLADLFSDVLHEAYRYEYTVASKQKLFRDSIHVWHLPVHELAGKICDALKASEIARRSVSPQLISDLRRYVEHFNQVLRDVERADPSFATGKRAQFAEKPVARVEKLLLQIEDEAHKVDVEVHKEVHNALEQALLVGDYLNYARLCRNLPPGYRHDRF